MTQLAEVHLLKQRIAELEETVQIIDRGQQKYELKLRDRLACSFAHAGYSGLDVWRKADEVMNARGT